MNIEPYRDSDKAKVLALMQEIFSSEKMRKAAYFNKEFWRWQYLENPYGKAVTMLAKDGEEVVGQYANIPVNIKFNGTTLISSVTIDLMVKKAYRRQGLFRKMAEAANDKLLESGIALSFAFPSRAGSYSGFVEKLGWFRVGDLKTQVKFIFPKFSKDKRRASGIEIDRIGSFSDEADIIWGRLKHSVTIGIIRNKEYLNWRYFKNPSGDYDVFLARRNNMPAGYIILKTVKFYGIKTGIIVDMFCLDALDVVTALVRKAESHFFRSGAFVCMILKTKLYENLLESVGFRVLADRLSPKNYTLIAKTNVDAMDLASLMDLDKWFLGFGDWDVV